MFVEFMKNYINGKLEEFNRKCCIHNKLNSYDGDYKKRWKRDYNDIKNSLWREIMSATDICEYVDRYIYSVEREISSNNTYLDIYDIDLALYRAVYAIQKMACCYDNNNCDFSSFDKSQIDALFEKLNIAYDKIKNEIFRRSIIN